MLLSIRTRNLDFKSAPSGSTRDPDPGVASKLKPIHGNCNHGSTEEKIISATA